MDVLIEQLFTQLFGSGVNIVLLIGWVLYLLERLYLHPRREKEFREDINKWRNDYHGMSSSLQEALSRFAVILEVIKDRTDRNGGPGGNS